MLYVQNHSLHFDLITAETPRADVFELLAQADDELLRVNDALGV